MDGKVAVCIVVGVVIAYRFLRRGRKESYSLDHAILNTPSPTTLWMNMGYWRDTISFPEACAALFRLLVTKAEIVPDLEILDIGSGCGDSTYQLSQLKPRRLTGVTSEPTQSAIARRRFPGITFVHADAVEYMASLGEESVDRIFALDCAYHFSSRKRFLKHSARVLRPNGRIALTDLVLGNHVSAPQKLCMRLIALLTGAPYSNFKVIDEYRSDFIQAGFENVNVEDISKDVFPGLSSFIHGHHEVMTRFGIGGNWMGYLVFARILRWWLESHVVSFVIVDGLKACGASKHI